MTNQDYVTYETAKLLKAAGYPQPTSPVFAISDGRNTAFDNPTDTIPSVTLWDAMKWLREEKRLMVIIETEIEGFYMSLKDLNDNCYVSGFPALDGFENTYEAACDNGIAAACEWLISNE